MDKLLKSQALADIAAAKARLEESARQVSMHEFPAAPPEWLPKFMQQLSEDLQQGFVRWERRPQVEHVGIDIKGGLDEKVKE